MLDRLRYIAKYRHTLSVSPRERYDFLVSICSVSLVSCRWLNSRGVEQWLQCRLPKSISSFGDTFDAPRPWSAIRLSGFEDDHVMGIETYDSMVFSAMKQILNDVHDANVSMVTLLRKQKLLFDPFRPLSRLGWLNVFLLDLNYPSSAILVESPPHLRFRIKSGILHNTIRSDQILCTKFLIKRDCPLPVGPAITLINGWTHGMKWSGSYQSGTQNKNGLSPFQTGV